MPTSDVKPSTLEEVFNSTLFPRSARSHPLGSQASPPRQTGAAGLVERLPRLPTRQTDAMPRMKGRQGRKGSTNTESGQKAGGTRKATTRKKETANEAAKKESVNEEEEETSSSSSSGEEDNVEGQEGAPEEDGAANGDQASEKKKAGPDEEKSSEGAEANGTDADSEAGGGDKSSPKPSPKAADSPSTAHGMVNHAVVGQIIRALTSNILYTVRSIAENPNVDTEHVRKISERRVETLKAQLEAEEENLKALKLIDDLCKEGRVTSKTSRIDMLSAYKVLRRNEYDAACLNLSFLFGDKLSSKELLDYVQNGSQDVGVLSDMFDEVVKSVKNREFERPVKKDALYFELLSSGNWVGMKRKRGSAEEGSASNKKAKK
mmetsp:Transcript_9885/g.24999  ORF Transcript_9885/g.24999 Transcript_9885/m.24999 type:complete len:377 (-) Transcript_9885:43-1173(-)